MRHSSFRRFPRLATPLSHSWANHMLGEKKEIRFNMVSETLSHRRDTSFWRLPSWSPLFILVTNQTLGEKKNMMQHVQ
jgi:hypothetical protein